MQKKIDKEKADRIKKEEYDLTVAIWKLMSKYIPRLPLSEADYKELVADGNELALTVGESEQSSVAKWIDAVEERLEHIDLAIKEAQNDEK